MKQIKLLISIIFVSLFFSGLVTGQEFQPENIGRGTVAVVVSDSGVYFGYSIMHPSDKKSSFTKKITLIK